jgi:hypothetical protein
MSTLARDSMGHRDNGGVRKGVYVVVYLFRQDMLRYLATPNKIYRHDVRAGQQVVQCNWCNRAVDIGAHTVDPVRHHSLLKEEFDRVSFSTSNVEHRSYSEAVYQISPEIWYEGRDVSMADVPSQVFPFRIYDRVHLSLLGLY